MHLPTPALVALLPSLATAHPLSHGQAAEDACNITALHAATDAYVAAQTAGSPAQLSPLLSPSFTYVENNIPTPNITTDTTTAVLSKRLTFAHRRTNTDALQCATYTELVATAPEPYVIGTQLWLDPSTSQVRKLDTVASTTGSWLFDAAKTLQWVRSEAWDPIPAGRHDTRAVVQAAGDAWLDMWSNATAASAIPFGTPCARLEGSAYTGTGKPDDSCRPGIPSNHSQKPNVDRRYVIDLDMGSVSIFCKWQHMMDAADSHEFRLEGGKLRYVHTMTVCPGKVCKL